MASAYSHPPSGAPEIALGTVLRRGLAAGERHVYRIRLERGSYLKVVVFQRGTDACVALSSPGGRHLLDIDTPNGREGPEQLSAVAPETGEYRIEVRGTVASPGGAYELTVEELRPASSVDRQRAAAVLAFATAERLRSQSRARPLREAITRYEEALGLWRLLGDSEWQALTLHRLGQAWSEAGEVRRAHQDYLEALHLIRTLGDRSGEIRLLNDIGPTYRRLGEPEESAHSSEQALQLARQTGDHLAEVTAINNLGVLYYTTGEAQKALTFFERALLGWRELKDTTREADTLLNLGESYTWLGHLDEAMDMLNRALALKRQVNDRRGQAVSLSALGWAQFLGTRFQAALASYDEALRLRREVGDQRGEAATLDRRGTILSRLGRKDEALASYQAALRILQRVGDRLSDPQVQASIGWLDESCGRSELALSSFEQAIPLFRQVGDQNGEAYALLGSARASLRLGRLPFAQSQIEQALGIVETVRSEVESPALRASYLASRQEYYELFVRILMERNEREPGRGWGERALEVSNRSRARSLLESLAEVQVNLLAETEPGLLAEERSLEERIRARERQRFELLAEPSAQQEIAALERELRSLLLEEDALQGRIRAASPRYAAFSRSPSLRLRDIQDLLDPETLLLWYALGEDRSYLWVVGPDSITSYPLAPRAEIENAARQVYQLLSQSQKKGGREQAQLATAFLSNMILAPVAGRLKGRRLLIASDGALQYIPFGVLPVPRAVPAWSERRPLLAEHEIVNIPSAAVLALVRRELAGRRPAPKTLAVVADPVFRRDDPRVTGRSAVPVSSGPAARVRRAPEVERAAREVGLDGFDRLAYATTEARAILSLVPDRERLQALGFRASRATVLSGELGHYRIVHFATHGLLNEQHPELSGVVLSLVDEEGRLQDGFLRVQDLVHLSFPADLVVLSACRTALGTEIRGEGLVGLTHGFLVAGAGRVLVSLWNVNDLATAELMARFYRHLLQGGQRPAAALREAQLSMLGEERWAAPYYWAGFTLQGEWR